MKTLLAAALLLSLLSVDLIPCLAIQGVILLLDHLCQATPSTAAHSRLYSPLATNSAS
jgi:hypothetical protein